MKITKDTNKLSIDVVKAINFILVTETSLSLFISITNTPNKGIKSKDDNSIKKKQRQDLKNITYNSISYTLTP